MVRGIKKKKTGDKYASKHINYGKRRLKRRLPDKRICWQLKCGRNTPSPPLVAALLVSANLYRP